MTSSSHRSALALAGSGALFLGLFFLLQWSYQGSRGTRVETLLIDHLTVAPSAAVVGWLTPGEGVVARGHQLVSPYVKLSVLNGCEGTEVVLLLAAAMLAFGTGWRHRLIGIVMGSAFVYLLNQGRVVGLFYCLRYRPSLFESLHGYVAPTLVVALAAVFFMMWISHDEPRAAH